jgi:hypothetical protein
VSRPALTRVRRGTAAFVAVVAVALLLAPSAQSAEDATAAVRLLQRSETAPELENLDGVVEVSWRSGGTMQRVQVDVQSNAGVLSVSGDVAKLLASDGDRWTTNGRSRVLWSASGGEGSAAPSPTKRWTLSVSNGPTVAGVKSMVVRAARRDSDVVRVRYYLAADTGLLLRRELYDVRGKLVAVVGFVSLNRGAVPATRTTERKPRASVAPDARPSAARDLKLADEVDGYRLLGVYRREDGSWQLRYGDGLFTISVFQQAGQLDTDAEELQRAHSRWDLGSERAWVIREGTESVATWDDDGLVITAVTDAPIDELHGFALAFAGNGRSWAEKIADFVVGPFGWD